MQTTKLPPEIAVRMVWSLTEKFHRNGESIVSAKMTETLLEDIRNQTIDPDKEYINGAIATMYTALRSLDTVYRGRELNFEENEKLRKTYLEAVQKNIEFGKKAMDYLKTLPTMVISGTGGVTAAELLFKVFDIRFLAIVGLFFAGLGFLGHLIYVRLTRNFKLNLYVTQDYERNLYYEQYVNRVTAILQNLYDELDHLHQNVFGFSYSQVFYSDENNNIEQFLSGIHPTFCKSIHKHMSEKKIKSKHWTRCETGFKEIMPECPVLKSKTERLKIFFSSLL